MGFHGDGGLGGGLGFLGGPVGALLTPASKVVVSKLGA